MKSKLYLGSIALLFIPATIKESPVPILEEKAPLKITQAAIKKPPMKINKEEKKAIIKPVTLEDKLEEAGLNPRVFKPWFKGGRPAKIHYWKGDRLVSMVGKNKKGSGKGLGKILNISDRDFIEEIKMQRDLQFHMWSAHSTTPSTEDYTRLSEQSFKYVDFRLGLTDDGQTFIAPPLDIEFSLQGPDNHFDWIHHNDEVAMRELIEKTVSLGHGGAITLAVDEGGWLFDGEGADFVVYENPYAAELTRQEFAIVGVSKDGENYHWFPCRPQEGLIQNCAGVLPTKDGGDAFDLSFLGVDKIKYIKIRDTGLNHNSWHEKYNTQGFDLDSLKLIHAFKKTNKE